VRTESPFEPARQGSSLLLQKDNLEKPLIEQKPDMLHRNASAEDRGNPNRVPWTAQQTFRAVILTLVPWIGFNLLLAAMGGNTPITKPLSFSDDLAGAIITFIFTALIEGAFLLAPLYYARKAVQYAQEAMQTGLRPVFKALGLRRFHVLRTLPWIVGLLLLIVGLDWLYGFAITFYHLPVQTNDQVVLNAGKFEPVTAYALLAGSVIIAPFCEELFFRGFVLPGLLKELSPLWSILISAALFAVAHADPGSFVPLFVIGLALGFLRLRSGSTWASMSLHILNNLLSSVTIILALHNINLPF
jgi:membrane protease YdiL (CAAX protease family)